MRRFRRLFLLLTGAVALLGCSKESGTTPGQGSPKPPEVNVSTPVMRAVTEYEEFTGMTQAMQTIEVRARVSGYLAKIYFKEKEGAVVNKGDLLFEIDPRPYRAEVAQADANVVQAEAHAERLTSDLARAEKLVGGARFVLSQEDFEKIRGDQREAVAAVGSAKAARDRAKLNLEFTEVRAPISGRISRRMLDEWNMIKADETPLTNIVSLDPMYAYFDVDESTALRLGGLLREGKLSAASASSMPVELGLANEEGFPHRGTVDFIDNQLDANTGTLRLRGIFPNPQGILTPGLFVRIRLPLGSPHQALLVAERALGRDQAQKYLFVVNQENKVVYRRVKVGRIYDGFHEVTEGLAPGERVIVSGLQRVRPDIVVEAQTVPMPAPRTADQEQTNGGAK